MDKIIESCKYVVDNSLYIKIDYQKIDEFCNYFNHEHIEHWINEAPFNFNELNDEDRLRFFLVFNSISFSYWGNPKWKIEYNSKNVDGAYGMISCIARAIENGVPILNAKYLSEITSKDLEKILLGNVQIPLFEERLRILREVGSVLLEKFDGDFVNMVKKADGDALKMVELLVDSFPSFSDVAEYKDRQVFFYKRAQLLVADIAQGIVGSNFGITKNIDKLTACADYKLPFILRRLEIFSYSDELAKKIDNRIEIEKGSEEEIELRANTIWVVDVITSKIRDKIADANAIHVNDHIWMLSQEKLKSDKPYHLTRTIAY